MSMSKAKQQDHKTKTHLLEKLFWDGLLELGLIVHSVNTDEQIL